MGILGFGGVWIHYAGSHRIDTPQNREKCCWIWERESDRWNRTWWSLLRACIRRCANHFEPVSEKVGVPSIGSDTLKTRLKGMGKKDKLKLANPLAAIGMIFYRDTALVLWMAASPYAVWYCVQTSIPAIYEDVYHYNEFQIGLSYLTGGAGTVIDGNANGRLIDWNYRTIAKKIGHNLIDRVSGNHIDSFSHRKS